MKKMVLILLLSGSVLLAKTSVKLEGTIAQIYDANKTLLVDSIYGGQMAIKILPNTEIEMDDCGIFGMDKDGTFKDLEVGNFLSAKISYGAPATADAQAVPVARELEIKCYKKAY